MRAYLQKGLEQWQAENKRYVNDVNFDKQSRRLALVCSLKMTDTSAESSATLVGTSGS